MGTAPNGYQAPKTNWAAGNVPAASDFNRIEGNIYAVEEGSRTIDPAQTPSSNVGSLRQFLDWFANRIKAITGKANWYDTPSKTLEDLNIHVNAAAPHSGHALAVHTHMGSDITSPVAQATNADTVDGKHASDFALATLNPNIIRIKRSNPDAYGNYLQVDYYRKNGTLFARSVLSGGTPPQYTTRTITIYDTDGTTVVDSYTFTITYDANRNPVDEW